MVLGTFGRNDAPQRVINKSLYQEILLLQRFNDIGGKVLKQKNKISLQPQKKLRLIFVEQTSRILEPSPQGLISSIFYIQIVGNLKQVSDILYGYIIWE